MLKVVITITTTSVPINPKKSSDYDLITGRILKELPIIGIKYYYKYIILLFNAVLLKGYFPAQEKVIRIIFILMPGISPNELTPYQPISFLLIASKRFESSS
jgi:hypothetical protein